MQLDILATVPKIARHDLRPRRYVVTFPCTRATYESMSTSALVRFGSDRSCSVKSPTHLVAGLRPESLAGPYSPAWL